MAARHDDTGDAPDRGDPRDDEIAERWAQIVADLGPLGTADEPGPQRPAAADDVTRTGGTGERAAPPEPDPIPKAGTFPVAPWVSARPEPRELTGRDWAGTDDIDAAEAEVDERDHFVPPDPGPVLGGDPLLTMAWLGAAGIPIGLLVVLIAWRGAPTILLQSAGVVFLLSCLLLVWRMPHHRDDSDDGPGAVV
jgi:hypothetical protein